jgi:hypothetical protein
MRRGIVLSAAASILLLTAIPSSAAGTDVRLTHDEGAPGYVSAYTLATGQAYTDDVLDECSISHGRQNEPAIAVDPRDTRVLVGSANDYCGTYAGTSEDNNFGQPGPIWLGYYRSENSGGSFVSSLVPGYPGDESPFADQAHIRTASAGDPVIAWDDEGRAFFGSESSDDPAGSLKTFGDEWVAVYKNPDGRNGNTINDGKAYVRTELVTKGSSAPFLLGKFNDKTAIEADRTQSECNDNVYFSWSRFTGNGGVGIYFSRSTDHGRSWSSPMKLTASTHDVQNPDIAITGSGTVYVTYTRLEDAQQTTAVGWAKSTDCGQTFTKGRALVDLTNWEMHDQADPVPSPESADEKGGGKKTQHESPDALEDDAPTGTNRDCGDFLDACAGPYTFPRAGTGVRSTADQYDTDTENVYIVVEATKPGTEVDTGTTYFTVEPGVGSQAGIFFIRLDGATGDFTGPTLIDDEETGHQFYPDISADGGVLHAIWYDTRNDPEYSATRPICNDEDGVTSACLDVFGTTSTDAGETWATATLMTDEPSNPNYEQYDDRAVPFIGDYTWVTSMGAFAYGTWTDLRNVVQGEDPREAEEGEDADATTADVKQCREHTDEGWTGDQCPHDGGLDANIYGDTAP